MSSRIDNLVVNGGGTGSVEVLDTLDSTSTIAALSANKGRELKETIDGFGEASTKDVTDVISENSQELITSGAVYTAVSNLENINSGTFNAFSKLGMTEESKTDGYEIALAKSTNTAEKTKVKVPVFDAQNVAKNPVGLVDEIFVEDMTSMMDDKIDDALKDFTLEVIDNLTSTSKTAALSANQGKVLNEKIEQAVSIIPGTDGVDIASENGKLRLANRLYDESNPMGKGYVILRANKTFAEQVAKENTIYEIRYDFDLGGETVTIPSGCELRFVGGKLSNGTLNGNETFVAAEELTIFSNVKISGTYINSTIYAGWWELTDDNAKDVFEAISKMQSDTVYNHVVLPNKDINWTPTGMDFSDSTTYTLLFVSSNTKVSIPCKINVKPNSQSHYRVISVVGKKNVTIDGGELYGDVEGHDYSDEGTHEWGCGVFVGDSSFVTIKNITCNKFVGDGITISAQAGNMIEPIEDIPSNIKIDTVKTMYNRRQGISVISANKLTICNSEISYTGKIKAVLPTCGIDFEPNKIDYESQGFSYIFIDNCLFRDNVNNDILFHSTNDNRHITISNCQFLNNNKYTAIDSDETYKTSAIKFSRGRFEFVNINNCYVDGGIDCNRYDYDYNNGEHIDQFIFNNCYITGGVFCTTASDVSHIQDYIFNHCAFNFKNLSRTYNRADIYTYDNTTDLFFNYCTFDKKENTNPFSYAKPSSSAKIEANFCLFNGGYTFPKYFNSLLNNSIVIDTNHNDLSFLINIVDEFNVIGNTFIDRVGLTNFCNIYTDEPNQSIKIKILRNLIDSGTMVRCFNISNSSKLSNATMFIYDNVYGNAPMVERNMFIYNKDKVGTFEMSATYRQNGDLARGLSEDVDAINANPWNSGSMMFDTQRDEMILFKASKKTFVDGHSINSRKGDTANRPTAGMIDGDIYFDTTLSKPIWWNGSDWVDATGTTV